MDRARIKVAISRSWLYTPNVSLYTGAFTGVIIKNPATEAKIRMLAARTGELQKARRVARPF